MDHVKLSPYWIHEANSRKLESVESIRLRNDLKSSILTQSIYDQVNLFIIYVTHLMNL